MLPLIELKNYSHYILEYLINILTRHNETSISKEEYVLIMSVIFSKRKNFPSDLSQRLYKIVSNLNDLLLERNRDTKRHIFIDLLLKNLLDYDNVQYQKTVCDALAKCLAKDEHSFGSWNKLYTKHLPQSAVLLNYIGKDI